MVSSSNKTYHLSPITISTPVYEPDGGEAHEDEAQTSIKTVEMTGSQTDGVTEDLDEFIVTSAPVSQLSFEINSKTPTLVATSVVGHKLFRRICLPGKEEAKILIYCYQQSLGSWYHILHNPTTESILDEAYSRLSPGQSPDLAHVALLLSIFASGGYFGAFSTDLTNVFSSPEKANQACLHWKKNTTTSAGIIKMSIFSHSSKSALFNSSKFFDFYSLLLKALLSKY